jgi:Domain of unknown function (DUF5658)
MAPSGHIPVRSFQREPMASLLLFIALQICDGLTTAVFLRHGVAEANPLVRFALGLSTSPALPLIGVKAAGCALAWIAWRGNRLRMLWRANCFFAACVAWNLVALAK